MRKLQLVLLLICVSKILISQDINELDSLYNRIEKAKDKNEFIDFSIDYIKVLNLDQKKNFLVVYKDVQKALEEIENGEWKNQRLLRLAYHLRDVEELEKAKSLCLLGIEINKNNQDNWESEFYYELASLHTYGGKNELGIQNFKKALDKIRKDNPEYRSMVQMEVGRAYYDNADYSTAMDYYILADKSLEEAGVKGRAFCKLMHYMGSVFKRQNNDQKALDYYDRMLAEARKSGLKQYEGEALDLLAGVYAYIGEYDKEKEYLEEALVVYQGIEDEIGEAQVLMSLAHGEIYEGEYQLALKRLDRVEEISKKYAYKSYDVTRNRYRGNIYSRMGNFKLAEKYYREAERTIAEQSMKKVLDYTDLYRNMAYSYYKGGQFQKAYEFLDLHLMYKDTLLRERNQNTIHELEQQYENQKKEAEIMELNKDKEIADKELSRKELMINSSLIGIVLVLILTGTVSYNLVQNKKKNRIITEQKVQVEEKNQEIMDSITYAKRIQNAILPPDALIKENLPDSFILYKPKDIVAGDFYWMEVLSNSSVKGSPPSQGGVREAGGGSVSRNPKMNASHLTERRKKLRNEMTSAEAFLWDQLKNSQFENRKFRRQHSIDNHIVDFFCPSEGIIIELDGDGHFEEEQIKADQERDKVLESYGYKVLRFENKLVFENYELVAGEIRSCFRNHPDLVTSAIHSASSVTAPPCEGGELGQTSSVLIAAADCTGHGVPGAMVSVVCNNGLNRSVREFGLTDPGEILDQTRELVIQEFEKSEEEVKDGMDIALVSLEYEQVQEEAGSVAVARHSKLSYAGAHNPLWIIRKGSEEVEEIKANKQPIGKYRDQLPFTTHKVELNTGDRVYIFSDGYADQFGGEKGKKLKSANLKKLLLSAQDKSMEEQKEFLDESFEKWKGDLEQLDDVCIIGIQV